MVGIDRFNDEYGRGDYDEATGLYEWYEAPQEEVDKHNGSTTSITYTELLGHWRILEGTFHQTFGVDLAEVWHRKSWRWFTARIATLLAGDNPLSQLVAPPPKQEGPGN